MKIGWLGLGRLGLPCALMLADRGHEVIGLDAVEAVNKAIDTRNLGELPYVEPGVQDLINKVGSDGSAGFRVAFSLRELVEQSDVVFVAVQTPHAPEYGGTVPVSTSTRDFEYGYLVQAVREVVQVADALDRDLVLVIVSTVLPGTTDRLIRPLLSRRVALVYSPQFIAMGTTLRDFANPEFLLLGSDDHTAAGLVAQVFQKVHTAAPMICSVADAEMAKVAYNTFISLKIVWANHLAALCDATGADADAVVDVLQRASVRVTSSAYMRPGMGDGGACHPRDLIALADLEARSDTPVTFFHGLALIRDEQSLALAHLVKRWADQARLPVCLLGLAYKPGVPLTDGSPALLLRHHLQSLGVQAEPFDPHVQHQWARNLPPTPRVFVVSTNHPEFHGLKFPSGSVVIDPWGDVKLPPDSGVTLVRPGRR